MPEIFGGPIRRRKAPEGCPICRKIHHDEEDKDVGLRQKVEFCCKFASSPHTKWALWPINICTKKQEVSWAAMR